MSTIDERVVEMKFNNSDFQAGVRSTLESLQNLNKGLKLDGVASGLQNLTQATNSLANIEEHTNRVARGFSVMRIAAYTAIATITRQALYAGEQLVKSFTIDPIKLGFSNYEEQINAVQTILANTGLKGAAGMSRVNKVLADLNVYANQTVYNFSEMAKNIGTFTAAGVKLEPAAAAIKGIANLAAMSGATSQQASSAMYQLSQALAANQVKLQDWNSVVNAGIGGKAFQEALFNTGEAMHRIQGVKMGETFDQWTKSGHTFRQSLKDGWINAKVLSTTLQGFTGDMTVNQMKSLGYSDAQIKKIQEMGKVATEAATKIKTVTQLKEALREEVGTAYAAIFKTLFGDINQAKSILSPLHVFLENMLTNPLYAINRVLQGWAKLGGRVMFIDAIKQGFNDIVRLITPIREAFREIFPAQTGAGLLAITKGFKDLVDHLKISSDTANNLRRTFAGVFAVLDIGWQIIKNVVHFLTDLFSTASHGSGGILKVTGSLGDFLVALDKAVKKGDGLRKFFMGLESVIKPIVGFLMGIVDALLGVFNTGSSAGASKVTSALSPLGKLGTAISSIWSHIIGVLHAVWSVFEPMADKFRQFFGSLGTTISNAMSGINYEDFLHTINTALFAGLVLLVRRLVNHFKEPMQNPAQGFIKSITEPFEQLTATLKRMQQTLRATTILEIATAVGILAASIVAISRVPAANLGRALGAITVMFAQLFGSLILFERIGGAKGLVSTSAGLILFATALRILTGAVKNLAGLSWEGLAKGLVGVSGLIIGLVAASRGMSGSAAGMIRTGAGLILLAEGVRILVGAVKELGGLSWNELAKGLVGTAGLLVALALFNKFSDANNTGILKGAGIILLATGIKILASALKDIAGLSWEGIAKGLLTTAGALTIISAALLLIPPSSALSGLGVLVLATSLGLIAKALEKMGGQNWENIAKGLVTLAGALTLIAAALILIPPSSVLSAGAVLIVAAALELIAQAMAKMGGQDWENIAKGLITLAGSLAIIAAAMILMTEALPGAAALLVVSGALAVLTPILLAMGGQSWGDIAKGLITLGGALGIIGAAGILLDAAVPGLLGLGASIALIGLGVAAAGAGVFLFATGLAALAVSGIAAAGAISAIAGAILGLFPAVIKDLGAILVALAEAVIKAAPALLKAAVVLITSIVKAIGITAPLIVTTFTNMLVKMLAQLANTVPKMAASAGKLILGVLQAVEHYVGPITHAFVVMLSDMLSQVAKDMPRFVSSGSAVVVSFLNGLAKHMGSMVTAGTNVVIAFLKGVGANSGRIANQAMQTIVQFVNALADAIERNVGPLRQAGMHLAFAIADGMTLGLAGKVKDVAGAAENMAKGAYNSAKSWLKSLSPSKRFQELGSYVGQGFALGIVGSHANVLAAWGKINDLLKTAIDSSASDIKKYADKLNTLEHAHKKNAQAIRETTAALKQAEKEHTVSIAALNNLDKAHAKSYATLKSLGSQYDTLTQKISDANDALKAAIQTRDDYNKQVTDAVNTLPDITDTTNLGDYINQLGYQVNDATKFAAVLDELKKLGLNDAMYKELADKGPTSLNFAEQLLAGGATAIQQVDQLSTNLQTEAGVLGKQTSAALYQAGVNAAQGLVNGLTAQQKKIDAEMTKIAQSLVAALKKELKIKSPSEVFHDLGVFTTQGMANGLRKAAPLVEDATRHIGKTAVESMKKAISGLNDLITQTVDVNPTIAPVVDLTEVHKGAAQLSKLMSDQQISVSAAYSSATDANAGYQANKAAATTADVPQQTPPGDITFIQNNNSPKALSPAEIYRMTKNQLSLAKGVVVTNAA